MPDHSTPDEQANVFAAEVSRWLEISGYSRTRLGKEIDYSRTYVSKVASGSERGSRTFADRADTALNAGGAIIAAWIEQRTNAPAPAPRATLAEASGTGLVDDQHLAELVYEAGVYRLTHRRRIVNHTSRPVTRYLIRIAVDRYPGQPERSNRHYREHPLTWEELDLHAWYGRRRDQSMAWTVQHDRDAFKEIWLHFESRTGQRFPLYPGAVCWIEYTFTVGDDKWGHWYRRAIRFPTNHLAITLDFPARLEPVVWGQYTSLSSGDIPLDTPISITDHGHRRIYAWSTTNPPLHARYTMEWTFRNLATPESNPPRPSQVMAALGIVQDGDPVLRQTCRHFDLPEDADDARRVVDDLVAAAARVATAHAFGKGMGISAPQIGIDRAAAIAYPPGDADPIVLLNPHVVETSPATNDQYEGCLSFFDVRCHIRRPLQIHVEHISLDGNRHITVFNHGIARLVAHEIDHLHGTLCHDRLPEGQHPIPVEQYHGTGSDWTY